VASRPLRHFGPWILWSIDPSVLLQLTERQPSILTAAGGQVLCLQRMTSASLLVLSDPISSDTERKFKGQSCRRSDQIRFG
jgi:hypothetical protein